MCHTLHSLRRTLQDLPSGLYETYDRILSNVPEVHRVHVQRALIWLAFSREPMTLGQVAEAVLVGREQQSMDAGDQFRDVHDLLDLCSSFVCLVGKPSWLSHISLFLGRIDREHIASDAYLVLRLAHSSVKEYILSGRTDIASLSMHRLTSGNAQRSMAEVCLVYLNQFDEQSLIMDENLHRHQFLSYAAFNWWFHYDEMPAEEEDSVVDLLLTFLNTHHYGYAYGNWLGLLDDWYVTQRRSLTPLAVLSSLGAPRVVRAVLENATEVPVTEYVIRKSFYCASRQGYGAVVQVLPDAGARLNRAGVINASSLSQALREATWRGLTQVVELLISRALTQVVELLISKGATAKGLDYSFISESSARQGKADLVKFSLDCATTKCEKIKVFYEALQAAILERQCYIIEYLMVIGAGIDITAKEDLYFATLQTAFFQRDYSTVYYLLTRASRSEARVIRRAKLKVLDTSCTPRTKLVLLQILDADTDHPLLKRNHERDYIPPEDAYWESAVKVEYAIKETLLEERKLLEEEELIEETTNIEETMDLL